MTSFSTQHERYLYDDKNELGAFPDELRILGLGKGAEIGATLAIEKHDTVLIPLHDLFGNITALIESNSGHVVERLRFSAFGDVQSPPKLIPWGYQSKRHVQDLVFFGRRLFDPDTGRWLSPDPKGFIDGPNLYQFLLNNPLLHVDLYGEHVGTRIWEVVSQTSVGISHGMLDSAVDLGFLAMDLSVLGVTSLLFEGESLRPNYFFVRQNLEASYKNLVQDHLGGSDNYYYQESRIGTYRGVELGMLATGVYSLGKYAVKRGSQIALKHMSKGLKYEAFSSSEIALKNGTRLNKLMPHPEALGSHSSFKLDPYTLKVVGYETYQVHPITGKWYPELRFRGIGKTHGGWKPPFILEPQPGKGPGSVPIVPRKPEMWELPYGYE